MTPLLNGQATKLGFASTSVTARFGASRLSVRAQVAPAKPPPMTTTRPLALCARAGSGSSAAAAPEATPLRKSRRVAALPAIPSSVLLRRQPGGDRRDLIVTEALGDAVHHGRRTLAGAEL